MIEGRAGHTHAPGISELLNLGSDVHAISIDGPVLLADHAPRLMPMRNCTAVLREPAVVLGKFVLNLVVAVHRFDSTGEVSQDTFARRGPRCICERTLWTR